MMMMGAQPITGFQMVASTSGLSVNLPAEFEGATITLLSCSNLVEGAWSSVFQTNAASTGLVVLGVANFGDANSGFYKATGTSTNDHDSDGLDSVTEYDIGTDYQDADSDDDALTDGAEVLLLLTNPQNPDTDGDGYSDGPAWPLDYSGPVSGFNDAFSLDASASRDTDGDGRPDTVNGTSTSVPPLEEDFDDDNDGIPDIDDPNPLNPNDPVLIDLGHLSWVHDVGSNAPMKSVNLPEGYTLYPWCACDCDIKPNAGATNYFDFYPSYEGTNIYVIPHTNAPDVRAAMGLNNVTNGPKPVGTYMGYLSVCIQGTNGVVYPHRRILLTEVVSPSTRHFDSLDGWDIARKNNAPGDPDSVSGWMFEYQNVVFDNYPDRDGEYNYPGHLIIEVNSSRAPTGVMKAWGFSGTLNTLYYRVSDGRGSYTMNYYVYSAPRVIVGRGNTNGWAKAGLEYIDNSMFPFDGWYRDIQGSARWYKLCFIDENLIYNRQLLLDVTTFAISEEMQDWGDHEPPDVVWIDIEQEEVYNSGEETEATLNLTDISSSPFGYTWSSTPTNISGSGEQITYNPSALTAGVYTVKCEVPGYTNCFDTCTVNILKVELTEIFSDQISGAQVNKLPANSKNEPMIMGNRSDDKAYLQVNATISPYLPIGLIGVRKVGTSTILANSQIANGNLTPISFDSESHELYEVGGGVDLNGNSVLDAEEIHVVFEKQIRTIAQDAYDDEKFNLGVVSAVSWLAYPTASTLLDTFLNQSIPSGFTESATPLLPGDLTHPIGATWLTGSTTYCKLYSHANLTTVLHSTDFKNKIADDAANNHLSVIQSYFANNPGDNEEWFGAWNFSFPDDLAFEKGSIVDDNLYFAFHGVKNANGQYKILVNRDLEILQMEIIGGSFEDVYDFDYTKGGLPRQAATVQAGFPNIGAAGKVFKLFVEYEGVVSF